MTSESIRLLGRLTRVCDIELEYGSGGRIALWFVLRCRHLTSVEHLGLLLQEYVSKALIKNYEK